MEYFRLNNGVEIPCLGFGAYKTGNEDESRKAVLEALETGYRLLDTAAFYQNEKSVGQAMRESGLPRSDIFLTTKLWLTDAGYQKAKDAFQRSLDNLAVDYVDLYLIHQPFNDYYGSWRAMEELYDQGLIRAIGVSNFMPDRLGDLMAFNKIRPAVNQVEINPYNQCGKAVAFMTENGVQPQAWAPFGRGRNGIFENPALAEIARQHRKTTAQVILRWLFQRGIVSIPKSSHRERMAENMAIFDFSLTTGDMARIASLDRNESSFYSLYDPDTLTRLTAKNYNI